MTFYDISIKMLQVNFQRYKLFFLSNVFSVALFYSFAALFTNESFMNEKLVNPLISNQIIGTSIFLGTFFIVFIPYSYNVFLRNRKHEYGILMTLGMSEKEVLVNILLENCVVAVMSLISGLILGKIISFVFYFILEKAVGIVGLSWYFNINSYKFTVIPYGIIMLFTLLTNILGFIKMKIIDLINERFRAEKRRKSFTMIFIAGVIFVVVSVLVMIIGRGTKNIWYVSMVIMFMGVFMIITHIDTVEEYLDKVFANYIEGHIMGISFIRQHSKSRNRIIIIAAWLMGFSVFFSGFCAAMYPVEMESAMSHSPYDLVYSNVFGMNKVDDSEIENLLNQNGISVKEIKQVDYFRDNSYNLLPVSEVNRELNCDYKVSKGEFIEVFQYDLNDSLEHEMYYPKDLSFNYNGKEIQLQFAGSDVKILFNNNPTLARSLVVNDVDFNEISSKSSRKGIIKLYSFNEWKDSKKGVDAVQKYLLESNHIDGEKQKQFYKASSKIDDYIETKQSAEFLSFLMFFIIVSFWGACNIIIHFKIKSESEEEERVLLSLHRIGVTEEEMLGIVKYKNMHYYIIQLVIGLGLGVFYNCTISKFYGSYRWTAIGGSFVVGVVLIVLQLVIIKRYSKKELLSFKI